MQNEDIKLFKKRKAEEAEPHIKTRDPVYYQEHGDRIFLVDNVFFKMPVVLFTKNSALFRDIFGPSGEMRLGMSEKSPYVLSAKVSPDGFRALCWALDASPTEISDQDKPDQVDIERLTSVAYAAHRTQCLEHKKWALMLVQKYLSMDTFRQKFTLPSLRRILTLGVLQKNEETQQLAWRAWLDLLSSNPECSSRDALTFGEKFNLRQFQGHIYYNEILRRMKPLQYENSCGVGLSNNDFNPEQLLCLHRGLCSLMVYWRTLRDPPDVEGITDKFRSCHALCRMEWQRCWNWGNGDRVDGSTVIIDPLGALEALSRDRPRPHPCPCKTFQKNARDIYEHMYVTMGDHFLGPPAVVPPVIQTM